MSATTIGHDRTVPLEERFKIIPGANWVELNGMFTPADLQQILNEVKTSYKKVPKSKSKH